MPPTVSPAHHEHHPQLRRTISNVLKYPCDSNESSLEDENKVIGSHLLLSKRSSNPVSLAAQQQNYNNLLAVAAQQHQQQKMLGVGLDNCPVMDNSGILPAGLVANLHKRLDRSQSEPVWQQQQNQLQDKQPTNSSRYKTELCRPFEENGVCKYGDKCQFAHGEVELRTLNRHPKYKTELCRTFHTIGICPYGHRCHFIHNAEESRVLSPIMSGSGPQATLTPPPALIPSQQQHLPLGVSQSLGLSPFMEKQHSPNGGSPTSPEVFFGDSNKFSVLQLENLCETLATSLHLNNKLNGSFNSNGLNNQLNNSRAQQQQLTDMIKEGLFGPSLMDTPPASPPESSVSPSSSISAGDDCLPASSLRLPIFQSINPKQ